MRSMLGLGVVLAVSVAATPASLAQRLEQFAAGVGKPCDFAFDPSTDDRYYVVDQDGVVRVIESGRVLAEPFIEVDRSDFTDRTSNWERGLLGIALDPSWPATPHVYLYYTDGEGATVTSRFTASSPTRADWETEEVLLRIEQPYGNHNGGSLRFGPDGMLYVGPGDGGAANDPHGAGQRLDTLLGKLLRIDVRGAREDSLEAPGKAYRIPADNPFVEQAGAMPEIFAYGLRNPWRYEFDGRGHLWIADVGQNRFEEVHVIPSGSEGGENFGWNAMEGEGSFKPGRRGRAPERLEPAEHLARGFEPPVWEYRHHPIASITGGYLYEGESQKWLRGRYICADFMSGRVWTFRPVERQTEDGRRFWAADDVAEHTEVIAATFGGDGPQAAISSFGRSRDGETLFVLDHKGGRVLRFRE